MDKTVTTDYRALLGDIVTVTVDRPLGSCHPNYPELYYSLNYGYIKGSCAEDGEEADAYIIGVDEPLCEFVGRVIAVIHRLNDAEDKLVVAPVGATFTKEQIIGLTEFQERFFDITLQTL